LDAKAIFLSDVEELIGYDESFEIKLISINANEPDRVLFLLTV
jgi:hypothetical protein